MRTVFFVRESYAVQNEPDYGCASYAVQRETGYVLTGSIHVVFVSSQQQVHDINTLYELGVTYGVNRVVF